VTKNRKAHPLRFLSKEEVFNLAKQLVSIPSHFAVGTRDVAEWLKCFLEKEGLAAETQSVRGNEHVNLIVRISGIHETAKLLLNGHLDTVPPSSKDFAPRISRGRLYGRGSADMKGAIAAMIMALVALQRAQERLQYGLIFTGVAGEEVGGFGTRAFLERGGRAETAIVGEPTGLRLVIAHKGVAWIRIDIRGRSAHASCPKEGVNAVLGAARVVQALERLGESYKSSRGHSMLGYPTISVGMIRGGLAPNVIPDHCVIKVDRRWLPGETEEGILAEIKETVAGAIGGDGRLSYTISREKETLHCRPFETPLDHPLVTVLQAVLTDAGLPSVPQGVSYGTDAFLLSGFGIPTVVWGPGDIRQAHSEDEYIDLNQVWKATTLYIDAIMRLCGSERKK